jgi:hypothetical protein
MSLAKFNATSKGFICHASPSNLTKKLIVNGRMNLSLLPKVPLHLLPNKYATQLHTIVAITAGSKITILTN